MFVVKESQAAPSTARDMRSGGGVKSGYIPHAVPLDLELSGKPSAVADKMLPTVTDGGRAAFPRRDGRPEGKGSNHP